MEIQDKKTLIASNLRKFYNFCLYTEPDGKTLIFIPYRSVHYLSTRKQEVIKKNHHKIYHKTQN